MLIVRILLQIVMVIIFMVALSGAISQPMTAAHVGNMIGVLLFGVGLFVATFAIGERKEKQWAHILGYTVNPKTFGVMLMILGFFMLFGAWRVLSGQPLGEPQGYVRGAGIIDGLFHVPILLVAAGFAMVWYGVKLFRARQPHSRKHRTRAKAVRAGDAER